MATLQPNPYTYGYIHDDSGLVAHDVTGTIGACLVYDDTAPNVSARTYVSFLTGSIPDNANITAVEIRLYLKEVIEELGIDVGEYKVDFHYDADRIGPSVTTGDWGGYAYCGKKSWGGSLPSLPDQPDVALATACVNVEGATDIEIQDDSVWSDTARGPTYDFRPKFFGGFKMWLLVTYTVPGGLFNRWNWKLPALPGFSNVIAAVFLPSGELQVIARFPARPRSAEA